MKECVKVIIMYNYVMGICHTCRMLLRGMGVESGGGQGRGMHPPGFAMACTIIHAIKEKDPDIKHHSPPPV